METRLCKGPLHSEGKELPLDSFASERSKWCRNCMRDYDKRRGRTRGASRASKKESKNNSNNTTMAKQTELHIVGKGVERVSIPEVDKFIDKYVKARDVRMGYTEQEVEAKTKLINSLRAHSDKLSTDAEGTIMYRHDDMLVILKHGKDDLKVRTEEAEPDEN
jgi:hypothetical protein